MQTQPPVVGREANGRIALVDHFEKIDKAVVIAGLTDGYGLTDDALS